MLYEYIFLIIYTLILTAVLHKTFVTGYNIRSTEENKPLYSPLKRKKPVTREEQKAEQLWRNIEAYDGTANGQVPIKE